MPEFQEPGDIQVEVLALSCLDALSLFERVGLLLC